MTKADVLSAELERIASRYARMLRSVGRSRGLGDAELDELIQEVRIRLWRALTEDRLRTVQTSYVYRAALSAALDMIRRRRARPEDPLEEQTEANEPAVAERHQPDGVLEETELGTRIKQAVDELDEPRDVVVRLYLSGYGRLEIAEFLGWTEPKVRNLLYRGLADLRTKLAAAGIGWGAVT